MRDSATGIYDAPDHPETLLQHQYDGDGNTFYNTSSAVSETASTFPSYSFAAAAPNTPQQQQQHGRPVAYNVHQQQQGELQRTFTSSNLPQGSRHTLPPNLNPNRYYSGVSSNQDVEHRIASYPSTTYSGHLSGQFNAMSTEATDTVPEWIINPPNFDSGGYHRSSTLSNSSFATSAARNSGTSFATTISTRSSLVSNDTYGPTKYEDLSSVFVVENDNTQPAGTANRPERGSTSDPARPFQCTFFCEKTFSKRHEWKRHEDSIHESQWKYICKPEIIYPGMVCQFCQCVADNAHLELNHQNRLCQELDDKSKHTFTRKDKFQLHVNSRHCPNQKAKKQWGKWAHPTDLRSEGYSCGFCNEHLPSWNVRAKHIGDHFEKDAPRFTMDRWDRSCDVGTYGCHNQSQNSPYSSHETSQSIDFYAESKALSDGESQAHTPPGPQYTIPPQKNMSSAANSGSRRLFYEEEDAYMDDDPGGETLFGDDMDYVE